MKMKDHKLFKIMQKYAMFLRLNLCNVTTCGETLHNQKTMDKIMQCHRTWGDIA